jgi:hypothetical protein
LSPSGNTATLPIHHSGSSHRNAEDCRNPFF